MTTQANRFDSNRESPKSQESFRRSRYHLAPRIIQARGIDGIARAVESIAVTSFANGADRGLRAVRTAVSKDQRLLEAHRGGWPVACAGERLGLQLVEPSMIVEQRDR